MELSIVCLSFNRKKEIKRNIPYYCKGTDGFPHEHEVIVVDNNSSDGSQKWLKKYESKKNRCKVILVDENMGVSGGRNIGYKEAKGEIILNVDDDSLIQWCGVESAYHRLKEDDDIAVLAPTVIHRETNDVQFRPTNSISRIASYHGSCHFIRRKVFDDIGYLDDRCTFGGEELDFSIRCHNEGYTVCHDPNIRSYHNSIDRKGERGIREYMLYAYNFTRINIKHFPANQAVVFCFRIFMGHLYHLTVSGNLKYMPKLLRNVYSGVVDGLDDRNPVSKDTSSFYFSREARKGANYGNIPLIDKIVDRLRD